MNRSTDFQVCCNASFQTCWLPCVVKSADLEIIHRGTNRAGKMPAPLNSLWTDAMTATVKKISLYENILWIRAAKVLSFEK